MFERAATDEAQQLLFPRLPHVTRDLETTLCAAWPETLQNFPWTSHMFPATSQELLWLQILRVPQDFPRA